MQYGIEGVPCSQGQKYDQTKGGHGMMAPMEFVGYYYPTLEIVGVDNGFIRQWAILISQGVF